MGKMQAFGITFFLLSVPAGVVILLIVMMFIGHSVSPALMGTAALTGIMSVLAFCLPFAILVVAPGGSSKAGRKAAASKGAAKGTGGKDEDPDLIEDFGGASDDEGFKQDSAKSVDAIDTAKSSEFETIEFDTDQISDDFDEFNFDDDDDDRKKK